MRYTTFLALLSAVPSGAQSSAVARVPLESPGPIEARSTVKLGNVFGLHALSDGRVLVNDAINSKLFLFDSTLLKPEIVAAKEGAPNSYGNNPAVVVPFHADSTLILDSESLAFLVYDPNGRVVRTIAAPKASDVMIIMAYTGVAWLDPQGRLVYRGVSPPPATDSAPIIRGDFETRKIDTIGRIQVVTYKYKTRLDSSGRVVRTPIRNPLAQADDWAVTADGTVGIVRSVDYHVDWIRPDGTKYSTPKMPFDWRPYSDAEKVALIDTARAQVEAVYQRLRAAPGGERVVTPEIAFVSPDSLPNYPPTIKPSSVIADRDGNVWIPPTTSLDASAGRLVYDVVNTRGQVARRVRLPAGRRLVGFGQGGVLYFTMTDSSGAHLERARIH